MSVAMRSMGSKLYKLPNANLGEIETLLIGDLSSIGSIGMETEEIDSTNLDSDQDYGEFIAGKKTPTEIAIEGQIRNETYIQQLMTLADTRTMESWRVVYPSGATWEFTAFVKSFTDGEKSPDNLISFSTNLRVSGRPVFTPHYSTDLAYTVRYYLTSSDTVAIAVEFPATKYPSTTVIDETKVTTDLGVGWQTRYQPPEYSTLQSVSYPTLSGVSSNDIVKVVYTTAPLDALAVTPTPTSGATNVAIDTNVTLSFNYKISELPDPILIKDDTDTAVAYSSSWDVAHKVLTINPTSDLANSTQYILTVQGAKDVYNRTLASTIIKFTTVSA